MTSPAEATKSEIYEVFKLIIEPHDCKQLRRGVTVGNPFKGLPIKS